MKNRFSNELVKLRNDENITQEQLSNLSGLPLSDIISIEEGEYLPNFEDILKILNVLDTEFKDYMINCLNSEEQDEYSDSPEEIKLALNILKFLEHE